jgi:hypothetical protein
MSGCVTAADREIKRGQHVPITPDCFNGIRILWGLGANVTSSCRPWAKPPRFDASMASTRYFHTQPAATA